MIRKFKIQKSKVKNKVIIILSSFVVICYLLNVFCIKYALAQSLSLSISPPIMEILIKPGKSITQVYKLTNNGDPVIITPRLFQLNENGIKDTADYKPENWITIINADLSFNRPFLLESKTEKQIILKVSPPQKAAEENYYRALVFSSSPNPVSNTSLASISQNIGSVLLVSVTNSGLLNKSAKISGFDLPKILDSFGPLVIRAEIQNTGKTYFRPNGEVNLKGPLGKATVKINPAIIFEGQTKTITEENTALSRSPENGIIINGFYLGKYEVEVKFLIDESKTEVSAKKTFIALPWKVMLATVILVFVILKLLRKDKTKHVKK